MIENNDGTFGDIRSVAEALQEARDNPNVACVHIGAAEKLMELKNRITKEESFQVSETVRYYGETLLRIEEKLDRVIKYFGIVPIVGQ